MDKKELYKKVEDLDLFCLVIQGEDFKVTKENFEIVAKGQIMTQASVLNMLPQT